MRCDTAFLPPISCNCSKTLASKSGIKLEYECDGKLFMSQGSVDGSAFEEDHSETLRRTGLSRAWESRKVHFLSVLATDCNSNEQPKKPHVRSREDVMYNADVSS